MSKKRNIKVANSQKVGKENSVQNNSRRVIEVAFNMTKEIINKMHTGKLVIIISVLTSTNGMTVLSSLMLQ